MNRITEIQINGKTYYLNFSVKAARRFCERYGDVDEMWESLKEMSVGRQLQEVIQIVADLTEQGAAYKKIVDGVEATGISVQDLEVIMNLSDFGWLAEQINIALTVGSTSEVEADIPNLKKTKAKQSE